MAYEKLANLKGPRGHGFANPRIVGDDLVIDTLDGTEVSGSQTVGNVRGPAPAVTATAATGEPGSDATVETTTVPGGAELHFTVPRGDVGPVPVVSMTATGIPEGLPPTVYRTGTDAEPAFELGIPAGKTGPAGPRGPVPVVTATATTGEPGSQVEVVTTPTEAGAGLAFRVPRGDRGEIGPSPLLDFAPPVALVYGSQPSVSVTRPQENTYRVQLGIPQGPPGTATESIVDGEPAVDTAWSSAKTAQEIRALIDDGDQTLTTTWSSEEIATQITAGSTGVVESMIQDATPSATTLYSSARTDALIGSAIAAYVPQWSEIDGVPEEFPPATHSHSWAEITGKPSTFTPAAHAHSASEITSGVFAAARLPAASTSARGAVELATTAEAVAGTAQNLAVTPEGLAAALSLVVTGPQYVRQVKGQGTMTAWVVRVGPLVTFQGHINGASNQALTAGYPFEGLQSITWALPKQDTILQAGLTMGRWGFRAVGVRSDGVFIVHEPAGTTSEPWTLHFFGSWFAADAV